MKHFQRFLRRSDGSVSVETVLIFPILLWAFAALFVFWDAFKTQGTNVKATYTIADMISREPDPVDAAYISGLNNVCGFLLNPTGRGPADNNALRVSVVANVLNPSSGEEEMELRWSCATGDLNAHDTVDALALLDPALRPVINQMVTDDVLSDLVENRPGNYGTPATRKIVVLMTDGANTAKYDIEDALKDGTTRVWYSEIAGTADDNGNGLTSDDLFPVANRNKRKNDGYFIEFPDNPSNKRWFRPESLSNPSDGAWFAENAVPTDLVQLDRHDLYARLSVPDIANLLFGDLDPAERARENGAVDPYGSWNDADDRLSSICEATRQNNDILIYTIAFQAPDRGQRAMQDCATAEGYYFPLDAQNISNAFSSIAGSINQLRLTQ